MLSPHERLIAGRYLKSRGSENFIGVIIGFAVMGILLGVMTLVVVTSIMNGVRDEMLKHFIGLSGHVHVYHLSGTIPDEASLTARLATLPQIKQAVPVIQGQVMITARGVAKGAQVKAYDLSKRADASEIISKLKAGSWEDFAEGGGVLMGRGLAEGLSGQTQITLISPDGRQTIIGLIPRMKAYPIAGIFEFGMQMVDNHLLLMPYEEAKPYFKTEKAQSIEITLHSADDTAAMTQHLQQQLGGAYRVRSWQETNGAVFEALNVQRMVMFLILMLIILVAAFNIIASLVMLVKDKQRDIAVMRSFGISRASIQKIFVTLGLGIGGFATLLGLGLGLIIAENADNLRLWFESSFGQPLLGGNLYFLSTLPSKPDWAEIGGIVVLALALSLLAALYPARRAAKLNPAEALRYE